MNTYATAVKYVETYKFSVIPLKPNSKEPLIDWKPYQTRFPTPEELRKWFLNTENNIGIVTGKISNLSVLDVDVKELSVGVFSPISVITMRGKHIYFAFNGEVNSASKIAEHIDVRGEGGYVVAPGSVVNGFKYRFISPCIEIRRLTPFPKELLNVPAVVSDNGGANVNKQKIKPLDWISEALEGIREGNRNATFTSIAGRLHRDRHSQSVIMALLSPHAALHSFPLEELNNVVQSITRYRTGNEEHTQENTGEDIETFLEGEETVEWIVPNVIAKSSIGFCAGLPETFKTWILAELAIEASRGGTWLGIKTKRTKVLFIDQERFAGETRRRFKKMLLAKGLTGKDLHNNLFIQTGSSVRLNLEESFQAFRRKLEEIRPELIIVDSFATFSTVAENDRQEVQKVIEKIKQLRQEFGCTILMIDHEGKSVLNPDSKGEMPDAYRMVGSVGKPAAAETVLTIRKDDANTVTVYHTKSSLAPAVSPIQVRIVDTETGGIRLVCNG